MGDAGRTASRLGFCSFTAMLVIATNGCHDVFDLEPVTPGPPLDECLVDEFTDMLDRSVWDVGGVPADADIKITDGHLDISVVEATTADSDPYGVLTTGSGTRDFTGFVAEVELLNIHPTTSPSETGLFVGIDQPNSYNFLVVRNNLVTRKFVAGKETGDMITYDPMKHRSIRMRHAVELGLVIYEARPVDGEWFEVARTTDSSPLSDAKLKLSAGSFNVAPAFTASFDHLRFLGHCNF
jgi:hypothetical protein